jgi:hypothetical protein
LIGSKGEGHTNPVVNPEIWENIVQHHIPASKNLSTNNQKRNHSTNTNIREENEWQLLLLEQDRIITEIEMRVLRESLVIILARQIRKQMSWPSKKLMLDAIPERNQRSILSQMAQFNALMVRGLAAMALDPGLAGVWNESGILLEVSGRLVMCAVSDLPAVIWDEQERVHDQAQDIVEPDAFGESTVSTLVC